MQRPITHCRSAIAVAERDEARCQLQQQTLLLAGSETHVISQLNARLTAAGYYVINAHDGVEAHALARALQPDLVIADVQLRQLSGPELCVRLAADPFTQHTPVILLAAQGLDASTSAGGAGNVRRIMPKPFKPGELLEAIEQELAELCVAG